MGNDTFVAKKERFGGSKIRMLEEVFAEDEWTLDRIEAREQRILDAIKERWPDHHAEC